VSVITAVGVTVLDDKRARPIVMGSTYGRSRVTLRNLGPFEVRIGDENVTYGSPAAGAPATVASWLNQAGSNAPNGVTLAPDAAPFVVELDGMEAVFGIAVVGAGEQGANAASGRPAGFVAPSSVEFIVVALTDPTTRQAY
jgi:hypothetical protein